MVFWRIRPCPAIAMAFRRDQNELLHFRHRPDGRAPFLQPALLFIEDHVGLRRAFGRQHTADQPSVRIEIISRRTPVNAVIMPSVRRLLVIPMEMTRATAILSITAPKISADHFAFRMLFPIFHDVAFNARVARVRMRSNARSLQPKRRMPATIFRQFATDFIIAVTMHETRRLHLAKRPEAWRIFRNIIR